MRIWCCQTPAGFSRTLDQALRLAGECVVTVEDRLDPSGFLSFDQVPDVLIFWGAGLSRYPVSWHQIRMQYPQIPAVLVLVSTQEPNTFVADLVCEAGPALLPCLRSALPLLVSNAHLRACQLPTVSEDPVTGTMTFPTIRLLTQHYMRVATRAHRPLTVLRMGFSPRQGTPGIPLLLQGTLSQMVRAAFRTSDLVAQLSPGQYLIVLIDTGEMMVARLLTRAEAQFKTLRTTHPLFRSMQVYSAVLEYAPGAHCTLEEMVSVLDQSLLTQASLLDRIPSPASDSRERLPRKSFWTFLGAWLPSWR